MRERGVPRAARDDHNLSATPTLARELGVPWGRKFRQLEKELHKWRLSGISGIG